MTDFLWRKKTRLSEQLKFFGATKQEFISIYAKKPKIRIPNKTKGYSFSNLNQSHIRRMSLALGYSFGWSDPRNSALYSMAGQGAAQQAIAAQQRASQSRGLNHLGMAGLANVFGL